MEIKWNDFILREIYDCRVNCMFNGNFELFVKIYFNFFYVNSNFFLEKLLVFYLFNFGRKK